MNCPVRDCGASVDSQVMESAPCVTERSAFWPPMSVRIQPGETALAEMFLSARAADCCRVMAFRAVSCREDDGKSEFFEAFCGFVPDAAIGASDEDCLGVVVHGGSVF